MQAGASHKQHEHAEAEGVAGGADEVELVSNVRSLNGAPRGYADGNSLYTLYSYKQANRRPHDWQGTPMPWDVFELGLHCWRAAWPHLALSKGTPADARPGGNIWAWPGRGSSRAGAGQKAHVHQRYTKHTLQTKVMRPLKKSM